MHDVYRLKYNKYWSQVERTDVTLGLGVKVHMCNVTKFDLVRSFYLIHILHCSCTGHIQA